MISQNPADTGHPNRPAPWGPYAAIALALAALPQDQLQQLAAVLALAEQLGRYLNYLLPNRDQT